MYKDDYYRILSVDWNATESKIKNAYRKLAMVLPQDVTENDAAKIS